MLGRNAGDPAKALIAVAHLLHEQSFDPVPIDELGIDSTRYEARWSESCELCGAVWIGTKAGEVLCIDLGKDAPRVLELLLNRGVRTLLHLHGPNAFGVDHTLLVGTDDGMIHRVHETAGRLVESGAPLHVESWWGIVGEEAMSQVAPGDKARLIRTTESVAREEDDRYTVGITAMARLDKKQSGASPIVVATRRGAIFLIDADPDPEPDSGRLRLRWLHTMSGWVQWILEVPGRDQITCISRGGELVRISTKNPTQGIKTAKLPLLPTAAAPFHDGFLLGTTEGLVYWSEQAHERGHEGDHHERAVSLPITRSPVLSIDRMTVQGEDRGGRRYARGYVILGLASGRIRVVHGDLLLDLAERRPVSPSVRGRSVDLGSSILAVEVLKPKGDDLSRCYILAALRDHSLRLFHVDSNENVEIAIERHWLSLARKIGEVDSRRIAQALLKSTTTPADRGAVWHLLIRAVEHTNDPLDRGIRDWLLRQIPTFLNDASPALLRLVALDLAKLAGKDADTLLEISLALLQALPRRHADWRRVTEQHLKVLNDAAGALKHEDGARVIAWTRFIRKYMLLGDTFSQKKLALRSLILMNYRTHKFVDALIYQALLFDRRNDLEWQTEIDGDVHSLHTAGSLVIAVTTAGAIWFFTAGGRRLGVVSGDIESPCASIGVEGAHVLTCVLTNSGGSRHLVVSWSTPFAVRAPEPGLLVFEIRHVDRISPAREYVTAERSAVGLDATAPMRAPVTVHSLCAVPGAPDLLLAGLDDADHHLGIIKRSGDDTWSLSLVKRAEKGAMPRREPSALASGKVPSRAIAASSIGEGGRKFLAAVGYDSGHVSFIWFDGDDSLLGSHTESFPGPVTAIEIAGDSGASKSLTSARDCYVGTSVGETFAGSVPDLPGIVEPVWRETYDSSVIALRRWRTPLYTDGAAPREVLVTATEKGRICFHETRWAPSSTTGISELNNYSFRGQRLDQVNLHTTLTCFTVVKGTHDDRGATEGTTAFVAAGPGGKIFKGRFCYTRDSRERAIGGSPDDFPDNLWKAFEQIRQPMIRYDRFFFPKRTARPDGTDPDEREREILSLVQLEHGALRRYLLHRQLVGEPSRGEDDEKFNEATRRFWSRDGKEIGVNFRDRLAALRIESREDRLQIKILVKSLGRAYLDRRLETIREEAESATSAQALSASLASEHEAVRAAAEAITGQILDGARAPSSSSGKIRSTAFKELFRVQVIRHLALEEGEVRPIRAALMAAINSCLRDDDRLVRVEVLRTIGITLRNIGVLRRRLSPDAADRLKEHLFRNDVNEILWLVGLLTENLERYTDFSPGTPHATTWYYIAALQPIFVLFPESTLRLCDFVTRGGVSIAALEVIAKRLPREVGANVRRLITTFYVVPCLRESSARKSFLNDYKASTLKQWLDVELPGFQSREEGPSTRAASAEDQIARRLIAIYDVLARFWEVVRADRLGTLPQGVRFDLSYESELLGATSMRGRAGARSPLGLAEKICMRLSDLARNFQPPCQQPWADDNAKTDALSALQSEIKGPGYEGLLHPVRLIVSAILAHWQSFYGGKVPGTGSSVGAYTLHACLGEGGYGKAYIADPGQGYSKFETLKIFRHIHDPQGKKKAQFLAAARHHKGLSSGIGIRGLVPITRIVDDPHPYYVMPWRDYNLEKYPEKNPDLPPEDRRLHAVFAAADLGVGLSTAHRRGITHGDIKPSNVLVHREKDVLHFELADFAMLYRERRVGGASSQSAPPPSNEKALTRQPVSGEWDDAQALAWVLYQAFFAPPLPQLLPTLVTGEERASARAYLASTPCDDDPELEKLITALISVFDGTCQDARTFLRAISPASNVIVDPPTSAPSSSPFSQRQIHAFVEVVTNAGTDRGALLACMPIATIGGRDTNLKYNEQILSDLDHFNRSSTSDVPHLMYIWLFNAHGLTRSTIFRDALDRFDSTGMLRT